MAAPMHLVRSGPTPEEAIELVAERCRINTKEARDRVRELRKHLKPPLGSEDHFPRLLAMWAEGSKEVLHPVAGAKSIWREYFDKYLSPPSA